MSSLTRKDLAGKRPALAVGVQTDESGEGYLFEYSPSSCRFVAAEVKRTNTSPGRGLVRIVALVDGDVTPNSILTGHLYEWLGNVTPTTSRISLRNELWFLNHPLRDPARAKRLYAKACRRAPRGDRAIALSSHLPFVANCTTCHPGTVTLSKKL